MNNLRRQKFSQLKTRRDLMLNARAFSIDDEDRAAFEKVIVGLEEEMYRRQIAIVRSMVIGINVLVIVMILGGCGKMMRGTGLIFEGVGDGVVAAGEHLQESSSQEK